MLNSQKSIEEKINFLKKSKLSMINFQNNIQLNAFKYLYTFLNRKTPIDYKNKDTINLFFKNLLENNINSYFIDGFDEEEIEKTIKIDDPLKQNSKIKSKFKELSKELFRFRCPRYFNYEKEFINIIENLVKMDTDYKNIVNYYGVSIHSYNCQNWYFYTEALGQCFKDIFNCNTDPLDNECKIEILKELCNLIIHNKNGIFINAIDEQYLYLTLNEGSPYFKILNYGDSFDLVEKLYPRQINNGNNQLKNNYFKCIDDILLDDFVVFSFKLFKNELKGRTNEDIFKNINDEIKFLDKNCEKYFIYKYLKPLIKYINKEVSKEEFNIKVIKEYLDRYKKN